MQSFPSSSRRRGSPAAGSHPRRAGAVLAALLFVASVWPGGAGPAPATAGTLVTVGPHTFERGPYSLQTLPIEWLPYYGPTIVSSCGTTDAAGVAMYRAASGIFYDHPVNQAQCAVNMLRNYRLDPDPAYLAQAAANAQRLVDRSVSFGGGSFFPYPFEYRNAGRSTMVPPWYSAMAQGIALSAFVRLHEWTGDPAWAQAASRAFASYKVSRSAGGPWVVGAEERLLWLDEYPGTPLDRVYNGHNFSLFGLYDYWRTTGSEEAHLLLLGALHSSYRMASERVRIPGGISHYCVSAICLANRVRNVAYHRTHTGQLRNLANITGHWHFASLAEAFDADSPAKGSGVVLLSAGVHDGFTFDSAANPVRRATATYDAETGVPYDRREVPGSLSSPGKNGVWLRIASGPLAGLWVRESTRARPKGFVDLLSFYSGRPIRVDAGRYTATKRDAAGAVLDTTSLTTGAAAWTYSTYARVDGWHSVLLSSGPLAGWWLPLDTRTVRDATLFTDVDASLFRTDIVWLTTREITRGCAQYRFCPESNVTREQVASFLVRALRLPAATGDYFTDDEGSIHEGDINRLAASGITAGCGPGRYCPGRALSRAEMASLLVRAFGLPPTAADFFADDAGSQHQGDINRLAAAGITGGCATERFCPGATVTRGQMAAFLHRAFDGGWASVGMPAPATAPPGPSPSPEQSAPGEPIPTPSPSPTPVATASPPPSPTVDPTSTPSGAEPSATPTPSETPSQTPSPEPSPSPPGG